MCLNNISKKKIATKDIICYKILTRYNNKFYTYYRYKRIKIGSEYYSQILLMYNRLRKQYCIEKGLHSFKFKKDAMNYLKYFLNYSIVAKCVIPKGSIYYTGTFDYVRYAYASNKIKYLNITK